MRIHRLVSDLEILFCTDG